MRKKLMGAALALLTASAAVPAQAAITWTDWTASTATTATGTLGAVGVGLTTTPGGISFVQTAGGTNYWTPWPVAGFQPTGTDIVALNGSGSKTITFSSAVSNLYMAINSWNVTGPTVFDQSFTVVGSGCGYWGCGSFQNVTATSFDSNPYANEIHGVIKFNGPVTSITFTDPSENWHGFTLGIAAVPEPATWAMMIGGFGAIGATMRRRRRTLATAAA